MAATANYLAIDLGASGGRAALGQFDGRRLTVTLVHRFENGPVTVRGGLYWDAFRLFEELKSGLRACTRRGVKLDGVAVDTWGVDFALLGAGGELLAMPRHYRDPRTTGVMERVFQRVPRERIYESTGIQFMPLNTLYQLVATAAAPARLLDAAERLVFMPDLFTYWLSGAAQTERTIASTSQMVAAREGTWDRALLALLGLPDRVLPTIQPTATCVGALVDEVADEVGQRGTPVILTASHDTASAVAAVPATGTDWAYISSGTWSLVGVERPAPLINSAALAGNFTNEAGVAGTTRFLRNVAGLWLVQESVRTWAAQGQQRSISDWMCAAAEAPPLRCFVDPDDARFTTPGDMPARIRAACAERGQAVPARPGEILRCALESLALKYRVVVDALARLTDRAIRVIHVVGGGVQNELLMQWTADATGRPVCAGPAEATAAGNVMVQALAQGRVGSLGELRRVVAASSELRMYEPREVERWEAARTRFTALFGS